MSSENNKLEDIWKSLEVLKNTWIIKISKNKNLSLRQEVEILKAHNAILQYLNKVMKA